MRKRQIAHAAIIVALVLASWSCQSSPGFREQAYYSLQQGGDKAGNRRQQAIAADAVRLDEFLSAYQFDLVTLPGLPVTGRLVVGGTGTDRESGQAYLMLALTAPKEDEANAPPRHWAIAIDASHSMGDGARWRLATSAAARLVARLRAQDRVTLITFAEQATTLLDWGRPADAQAEIARLAANPSFGGNGHAAGLAALDEALWTIRRQGGQASGVYVSELEGASDDLPARLDVIRGAGADLNVLGLPGGNEALLREFARAGDAAGSYVFLADEGSIEREFGENLWSLFDVAVRDVNVRVMPETACPLDSAEDSEEVLASWREWKRPTEDPDPLRIARMGPGETCVRLWRVPLRATGAAPVVRARVTGVDAAGRPFALELASNGSFVMPNAADPNSLALLKAVTVAREVQVLRQAINFGCVYGRKSFSDVMAQVRGIASDVREAQATLQDPEFARDLEALEAASRLTESEIARYRDEARRCGGCGFGGVLSLPFKVVALPFVIIGWLLFA